MSKLYVNEIYPQSGTTVTWNSALSATGDISSSGDIYTLGSISASNNVTIGGNLYISGSILGITASNAVTALNNQAANRLVSIGSTTTELDGEANLTFNGSVLTVAGNVSSSGDYYALGSISASNNLTVGGNIHASGTITCDTLNVNEINSSTKTVNTLEVVDKVLLVMSGTYPNNANAAGFQIGGHSTGSAGADIAATFFYNSTDNTMDLSTAFSSSGDIYSLGSVSASNNLAIGGNAQFSGSLSAASLSSSGDVYVLGSVSASNDVTIGGNLYISGTILGITASNAVTALNNKAENRLVSIGSTTTELDGEANLTFNGSVLAVAGNVSSSGDYYALGSVSASNNLAVGGNAELSGNVKIGTGGSTTFSVDANGNVSASGDYYALGSVSASNNLAVGGNLHITGTINQATVNSYLTANDEARLKAGATVSGSFNALANTVLGNASSDTVTIAASLTASAGLDLSGQRVLISGSGGAIDLSDARGNAEFSGSVIAATLSSSGDVYALGSLSASNNLAVGGNLHITGTLNKAYTSGGGHVSSSGDIYALGSVSASNNLAVGGNAQVSGSLSASLVYAYGLANAQSLSTITIPANYNSVLYGPISIDVSETITIGVDSNVKIVDIADV